MSSSESEEEVFVYPYDKWKASTESILTQKITKLSKSESLFQLGQPMGIPQLELKENQMRKFKEKNWNFVHDKCRFPRMIQTRSLLRDELEMLKINLSMHEKVVSLRESQLLEDYKAREGTRRKRGESVMSKLPLAHKFQSSKVADLLTEIDGSETAKTDRVCWKFLKRGPSARREATEAKKFAQQLQVLSTPVVELLSDSHFQKAQPIKITCPNCRFFIITQVKKISTVRTKLTTFVLTFIRFCLAPHVFYAFSNCVHLCPLCKIYLGFSPAYNIRIRKRKSPSIEQYETADSN